MRSDTQALFSIHFLRDHVLICFHRASCTNLRMEYFFLGHVENRHIFAHGALSEGANSKRHKCAAAESEVKLHEPPPQACTHTKLSISPSSLRVYTTNRQCTHLSASQIGHFEHNTAYSTNSIVLMLSNLCSIYNAFCQAAIDVCERPCLRI